MKNKSVFFVYLKNNKKTFIGLVFLFLVGIMAGIFFINNASEAQSTEIFAYINSLKENIKSAENINKTIILTQSIKQNLLFVILIWFLGCTLLGSFLIYVAVFYKGFSIGYTVSAIIATLGVKSRKYFRHNSIIATKLDFYSHALNVI